MDDAQSRWPRTLARCFVMSASVILIGTGAAKALSSLGEAEALYLGDPVFGVTFRHLLLVVGILEILVGCACFLPRAGGIAPALVAWMAANFLLYRVSMTLVGWHRPCHCLGSLTDVLHISPRMADRAAMALMIYLLVGGCASVWWLRRCMEHCPVGDVGRPPETV